MKNISNVSVTGGDTLTGSFLLNGKEVISAERLGSLQSEYDHLIKDVLKPLSDERGSLSPRTSCLAIYNSTEEVGENFLCLTYMLGASSVSNKNAAIRILMAVASHSIDGEPNSLSIERTWMDERTPTEDNPEMSQEEIIEHDATELFFLLGAFHAARHILE